MTDQETCTSEDELKQRVTRLEAQVAKLQRWVASHEHGLWIEDDQGARENHIICGTPKPLQDD